MEFYRLRFRLLLIGTAACGRKRSLKIDDPSDLNDRYRVKQTFSQGLLKKCL